MAFFDELTKKAKDVAAVAADRAKDAAEVAKGAAEVAKINMAIAGEQREIDKNYRTIGEWFVSEYEGQIPDAVRGAGGCRDGIQGQNCGAGGQQARPGRRAGGGGFHAEEVSHLRCGV